jgi:3-hydroxyacyl-CoA dehydrogenase
MSGMMHPEHEEGCTVLVIDNPPVNVCSADIRKALLDRIAEVEADDTLCAGVVIGAGKTFLAGSDLEELDLPLDPPEVIAAIESSTKPWVAAIHGVALAGGYELSLGCDARIAAKSATVGLPECQLGIMPPRRRGRRADAWNDRRGLRGQPAGGSSDLQDRARFGRLIVMGSGVSGCRT